MTTHSCLNCYEPACDKVGQDMLGCEHFVRADDIEIEPPDEAAPVDAILYQLIDEVEGLKARVGVCEGHDLQWDEMWAAILKARRGEGL